ncbi:uncharacterized protein PADG_04902 [Paracoccidioides brasiliensis Pb18]|uniref:AAA+ ATPase domain-containing protein n=1 Tax=Paracoccidioides brasiliensis (strain Pb18) TaxID=502780 RepID=C1GBA1_PARBD|nr:uncharacterized protein PADG_04902 [Paracoccidioides brasiliensis Pb18]EEH48823.2 hypothetical protein PADG_04902 [Paracoccidioides brasiliensis Pb18]
MRSKTLSTLQKTYDECYLMCSTAVFFEGQHQLTSQRSLLDQSNESEALRSWRSAVDTIHNSRIPSTYVPRTETEKVLYDSLKELEMQSKERIDLLNALSESREEAGINQEGCYEQAGPSNSPGEQETGKVHLNTPESPPSGCTASGWLGNGTVPTFTYSQLSRPPSRPPPPSPNRRPSIPQRYSGESIARPGSSGEAACGPRFSSSPFPLLPPLLSVPTVNSPLRNSSPEKRTMLTTLRSKEPKKSANLKDKDSGERAASQPAPSASRAAGLAWSSIARFGRESAAISTPRRSAPIESSSRRGYFSNIDLSRHTKTSYFPDYLHSSSSSTSQSQSRNHHNSNIVSSSLATDAAATAIHNKPSELDLLIDLSDPSPVSHTMTNAKRTSPNTSTSFLSTRPKHQPDYLSQLDPYLEQGPPSGQGNTPPLQRNKPCSTSQPQLLRHHSSETSYTPLQTLATSSGTPVAQNRGRRPCLSNSRLQAGNGDDALNGAISSMRSGMSITQGKPTERAGAESHSQPNDRSFPNERDTSDTADRNRSVEYVMNNLPKGIDEGAARQILNDVVVKGDEVHWDDVAGLEIAKNALKEAVVYPFLRPDLFSGLREPARGMLLFGPPGTGKTMLARAVATESQSTFFSVSASSLTSKWHGESEKLVRALFGLAKCMAPSIIFVDEIDSLLSARSGSGEAEVSRRTKTEFLIQWSDLQRAAAGREQSEKEKRGGDPSRVLVLAATNLPWDIDEAARRRFVRRQYIPLPEPEVRKTQIERLLSHQKHELSAEDIEVLVKDTDGFSGSDITALAKDAAMGPLRNLGEALLHTPMDQIRAIHLEDFKASLCSIRPSVSRDGLKEHEDWAREFGERGG